MTFSWSAGFIAQCLASVALFACAVTYDVRQGNWRKIEAPPAGYPDVDAFRNASVGLPDKSDAPEVFFKNASALFQTYKDSVQLTEAKLGALLGFVGGGTGVLALLSGSSLLAVPAFTPLLLLSILSLGAVFVCALAGLRPFRRYAVNVSQLCDFSLLRSMSGASRMDALMGWQYLEAARGEVPVVLTKGRWLRRCYNAFTLGVVALIVNVFLPVQPRPDSSASIILKCDVKAQSLINCSITPKESNK